MNIKQGLLCSFWVIASLMAASADAVHSASVPAPFDEAAAIPTDAKFEGHSDAPLLGAAIFAREGHRFVLGAEDRALGLFGDSGKLTSSQEGKEPARLVKVGPDRYGAMLRSVWVGGRHE